MAARRNDEPATQANTIYESAQAYTSGATPSTQGDTTAQRTRITDVLGETFAGADDGSDALDLIYKGFTELASRRTTQLMATSCLKFLSNEQSHDSRLAYPAVVIIVRSGNQVVYMPYFIVPDRQGDFEEMTVTVGTETYTLQRHPSEAMDDRAIADFTAMIRSSHGLAADVQVYSPGAKCVFNLTDIRSNDADVSAKAIRDLMMPGLRIIASTLLIERTGTLPDASLLDSAARNNQAAGTLNLSYKNAVGTLRVDENNLPIGGSTICTVSIVSRKGDNTNSLNRAHGSYTVGTTTVRPTIVQAPSNNNDFLPNGAQRSALFIPQLVIDDTTILGDPTPANLTLMVAAITPLLSSEVLRRMYDPKTVGFLNMRANLKAEAKPTAFAEKDVRANYAAVWDALFVKGVAVSMLLRLGSFSGISQGMFYRAGTTTAGLDNALRALTTLTKGLRGPLNTNSVRSVGVELVPIGTYKGEDRQEHPLTDIDLGWLCQHYNSRPQVIDMWAQSCDGSIDPLVAYGMKLQVLNTVTNGTARILDRGLVITFAPAYIQHLAMCLKDPQLNLSTNVHQMVDMAPSRWAPYTAADSVVTFDSFQAPTSNLFGGMDNSYATYGYFQ